MKRFWIAILSLGLATALSMPAFGASMDFGGSFRIRGWYNDNQTLRPDNLAGAGHTSFFEQRLRAIGRIPLADGVRINTRFDALEASWATPRTPFTANDTPNSRTDAENIQWEIVNMEFKTPIGNFLAGSSQAPLTWGTKFFASSEGVRYLIRYTKPVGPFEVRATWEKKAESQRWASAARDNNDGDGDIYALAAKYKGKNYETGIQWQYLLDNSAKAGAASATTGFSKRLHNLMPYYIGKFGNISLQATGLYIFGDAKKYDDLAGAPAGVIDVDARGWGGYLNARYTTGPTYLGVEVSYTSGDDPTTPDKQEGFFAANFDGASSQSGSSGPKPTLMTQNTTFNRFFGNFIGALNDGPAATRSDRSSNGFSNLQGANNDNSFQYSLYGGYAFTPKWDIYSMLLINRAAETPNNRDGSARFISDDISKELDVVLNYKITGQLTYSVQAAYWWTGDYFKGTNPNAQVDNTYVLMHVLDLSF